MNPYYIRTYCIFCKKVIYSDRLRLHGLWESESFQQAKDIFAEDARKQKLKRNKVKSHLEHCESFQRKIKSNVVSSETEITEITDSKAFVPSVFKR